MMIMKSARNSPPSNKEMIEDPTAAASQGNRRRLLSDLSASSGHSHRSLGRKNRVSYDEERLRKSRKIIDGYLRRLRGVTGKELSLNKDTGMCYFPFQKFVIVVEVPSDCVDKLYIYTCVCRLQKGDNRGKVMELALHRNYMQLGTRGATLGLDKDEVNLCLSTPVAGLSFLEMQRVLEEFSRTCVQLNELLDAARVSAP